MSGVVSSSAGVVPDCLPVGGRPFVDGVRGCAAEGGPRELSGLAPAAALERLFAARPARFLRAIPGRETFFWPDAPDAGRSCVVKRFRGNDSREAWFELLHGRAPRSQAAREADNLVELAAGGFPVPRALAWYETARVTRSRARSALVLELVPHASDLASFAAERDWEASRALLLELAGLVARLHAAGWYHRDLYLQHAVIAGAPRAGSRLVLLDCGRARRQAAPRARWFVKDLAAVRHSWPARAGADGWSAFLAHYLDARRIDGATERAAFARAVERKRGRLAAHAPRHVDPGGGRRSSA